MSDMDRREALKRLGLASAGAAAWGGAAWGGAPWSRTELERAHERVRAERREAEGDGGYEPKFLTPDELETVTILADLVIPADDRSGSASDAGVPEFIDFMASENEGMQRPLRGGLAWLDAECERRHGSPFRACIDSQRRAVLDDIAWPAKAPPEASQGVAFFNRFRDLAASGFWTSRMGMSDLRYMGNTHLARWEGCPPEALRKLGVSYGE